MAQKVITVNINVYEQTVTNRHSVYEIKDVNKLPGRRLDALSNAYRVPQRPPTGPTLPLSWRNYNCRSFPALDPADDMELLFFVINAPIYRYLVD